MSAAAIAAQVIDKITKSCRPYAVFGGRSVEMMPADGKRFAALERKPERMALLAGVFDTKAQANDIVAALEAVGG